MGGQDRGGGREGKKTSLRKNKINSAELFKKAHGMYTDTLVSILLHRRSSVHDISHPLGRRALSQICPPQRPRLAEKPKTEAPTVSPPAPPVITLNAQGRSISKPLALDSFCNLLSRHFDRDREAVLRRARDVRDHQKSDIRPRWLCSRFDSWPSRR